MAFLIFALTTCAVVPFGAQVLGLTRLAPREVPERVLMAAAVGYTLLAYALLGLGLLGMLTPWRAAVVLAVMAVCGLGHWDLWWEAVLRTANAAARAFRSRNHALGAAFLVVICLCTLVTALEPPTGRDFDGLAEHLAQAGTYVRHHTVAPLWFDHHSHFPATLQMLYALGLLYKSVGAAKLFHWFHGLMALLAAVVLSRRFLARGGSGWTGFVVVTTPMFLWLSGVAYVDLGVTAYGLLAVIAYLRWRKSGQTVDLLLMGVLVGCALTVKMQALALCGVLLVTCLVLAWRRWQTPEGDVLPTGSWGRRVGPVVGAGLLMLLIAGPWYLRTYLNTGNPVYPFAYNLFGGKHWSADRSAGYDRHQLEFGLGDLPADAELAQLPKWRQKLSGPREPWKWLAAPLALTYLPWEFEVKIGNLTNIILTSLGPLYLALVGALVLIPALPVAVRRVLWLFVPLWLWWFWSMQLARYLYPSVMLLAPLAGYAAYRCWHGGPQVRRALGFATGLWSLLAVYTAFSLALPALPVVTGRQSAQEYLLRTTDIYTPSLYIDQNLPADAAIGTYGEVRCFYFNRDYVWCEAGHSDLVPYEKCKTPADLVKAWRALKLTHILLNQQHLPGLWTSEDPVLALLRQAVDDNLLAQVTDFPTRPQFLLYEIRDPQPRGGRP